MDGKSASLSAAPNAFISVKKSSFRLKFSKQSEDNFLQNSVAIDSKPLYKLTGEEEEEEGEGEEEAGGGDGS